MTLIDSNLQPNHSNIVTRSRQDEKRSNKDHLYRGYQTREITEKRPQCHLPTLRLIAIGVLSPPDNIAPRPGIARVDWGLGGDERTQGTSTQVWGQWTRASNALTVSHLRRPTTERARK